MSPDYIRPVPTINLTADELAAVTAAIRRVIEDDRFPTPRGSIRCARRWESSKPPRSQSRSRRPRHQPKSTSGRGDNRRPFARRCYLSPSIHSVSACEPRPSGVDGRFVSVPRRSLNTMSLVRRLSRASRSGRRACRAKASENWPMSTQMSARCFAQVLLFPTALHGSI